MARTRRLLLLALAAVLGCSPSGSPLPARRFPAPTAAPGLHNAYMLSESLYSGGGPEDDAAFSSLALLGIKTIVSVDGARPDLDRARKFGLRCVHLPIGYNGVPRPQALSIARALRDLPGPIYIHCHHGKHRGPAAAAAALLCLGTIKPDEAEAWLRLAGTDPRYKGLHDAARQTRQATPEELDAAPSDFPATVDVGGMAKAMVEIDKRWEHLVLARKAGWKPPPSHPDIDPPHEAVQLAELYAEAARLPSVALTGDLRKGLADGQAVAKRLEASLRRADMAAAEAAYKQAAAGCASCHARHRDVPLLPALPAP